MPGPKRKWTDEDLVRAVKSSVTVAGVRRMLKESGSSSGERVILRHIKRLDLDVSHFKGQGWNRGNRMTQDEYAAKIAIILIKGIIPRRGLLPQLIRAGLKNHRCEQCGITEWQ